MQAQTSSTPDLVTEFINAFSASAYHRVPAFYKRTATIGEVLHDQITEEDLARLINIINLAEKSADEGVALMAQAWKYDQAFKYAADLEDKQEASERKAA